MKRDSQPVNSRREFLKTSVTAGAGAMAASLLAGSATAEPDSPPAEAARKKKGYELTPHVLDYYRSAKL